MRVAVHQPNFLPWPGYFAKMAQADVFVFLDDAQFSKNNIINRVRILGPKEPKWLTLPVSARLGMTIRQVVPSEPRWRESALSLLRNTYGRAPFFRDVWSEVKKIFESSPESDLASINVHIAVALAQKLNITSKTLLSSNVPGSGKADDRLVEIVSRIAPGGTYLSGRGGAKYQDAEKFSVAGLLLEYYRVPESAYSQGDAPFQSGLSIVDMLFFQGWERTAEQLRPR